MKNLAQPAYMVRVFRKDWAQSLGSHMLRACNLIALIACANAFDFGHHQLVLGEY